MRSRRASPGSRRRPPAGPPRRRHRAPSVHGGWRDEAGTRPPRVANLAAPPARGLPRSPSTASPRPPAWSPTPAPARPSRRRVPRARHAPLRRWRRVRPARERRSPAIRRNARRWRCRPARPVANRDNRCSPTPSRPGRTPTAPSRGPARAVRTPARRCPRTGPLMPPAVSKVPQRRRRPRHHR